MPFPDAGVELKTDGAWSDITDQAYIRDSIRIERGRGDEGAQTDPGSCSLTLNNRNGVFSPRNPLSPYFGKIGRNTPIRITAAGTTVHLRGDGGAAEVASTSALDITTDLDVRIDLALDNWVPPRDRLLVLMGRWDSFGLRSWRVFITTDGLVYLDWSPDGSIVLETNSRIPLAVPASGRLAIRATLDVDNGLGGPTVAFHVAPTMSGPWTLLGAPRVFTGGVTSIANPSPLPLQVGRTFGFNPATAVPAEGRVYAVQVRDGIDGTAVADVDFTAQAPGASSFVDAAGRTWTMNGHAKLTDRQIRFVGEVPSWPPRWDVSGEDVYTPIKAAGIMRRYGQGARALDSTLRRQLPAARPLAYWPMEDGPATTRAYSPIPGVDAMQVRGMRWGEATSLPSSAPLPVVSSSDGVVCEFFAPVPAPDGTPPSSWSVQCVYRIDQVNADPSTMLRILVGSGTVREWHINPSDTQVDVIGLDAAGNTVHASGTSTGLDLYKQWIKLEFLVEQLGGDIKWSMLWTDVGGDAGLGDGQFAGTSGFPVAVASPAGGYAADLDGMAIGLLSVWPFGYTTSNPYARAIDSWTGERAAYRARRLALEEELPLMIYGDRDVSEPMGAQGQSTLLELLGECADSDVGILHELRNSAGLALRLRDTLYNQPPRLTLSYAEDGEVAPPLEPEDDDQQTRNDITVTRAGGSSGRVVQEEGPLSVLAPPAGVGVYPGTVTRSLAEDGQTEPHAAWRVHLGTWDAPRYPVVHVNLMAAPHLAEDAGAVESGDRLVLTDLPVWLPPGDVDLLAQGYVEALGEAEWDIFFNCTPGRPWQPAVADDVEFGRAADTAGSELVDAVDESDTELTVATTTGPPWVEYDGDDDLPFDIEVGGEVMTVTAVTGTTSPQTMTVDRSVNGISKGHAVGTPVRLAVEPFTAL